MTQRLHLPPNSPASRPAGRPGRRMLLQAALAAGGMAAGGIATGRPGPAAAAAVTGDWLDFRRRFLHADGRVLDTGNGGISHSEGQGAAMLFAVRFDDRASFDRMLEWTRGVLRRPEDHLLAWAFRPGAPIPVPDMNNASDGDLLVAWSLAEAADRWGHAGYRALATDMARDLLRKAVLRQGGATLLLPGVEGFLKHDHVVVNPSYYISPAFRALARLAPAAEWRALEEGGVALADQARFGRWRLPADWVALPRGALRPRPAQGWPARFSYDAMRVPLNLAWGGARGGGFLAGPGTSGAACLGGSADRCAGALFRRCRAARHRPARHRHAGRKRAGGGAAPRGGSDRLLPRRAGHAGSCGQADRP